MSIEVKNLSFSYGERRVLQNVAFSAADGELLSILGPNGVGKSTLFRCILGLEKGYTGEILVGGENVRGMGPSELARRIAYIPQHHYPTFNYPVLDMVLMGTTAHAGAFSQPGKRERNEARSALKRLGMEDFAERPFMKISGGEQQLVLIARALAQRSNVLVMDEPTASLDFGNQIRVLTQIRALAEEGYTIILSTHNPEQSYMFSHRILAMQDGGVLAKGLPGEVVTTGVIRELYGIEANVESIRNDAVRVCVPERI